MPPPFISSLDCLPRSQITLRSPHVPLISRSSGLTFYIYTYSLHVSASPIICSTIPSFSTHFSIASLCGYRVFLSCSSFSLRRRSCDLGYTFDSSLDPSIIISHFLGIFPPQPPDLRPSGISASSSTAFLSCMNTHTLTAT